MAINMCAFTPTHTGYALTRPANGANAVAALTVCSGANADMTAHVKRGKKEKKGRRGWGEKRKGGGKRRGEERRRGREGRHERE